MKLTKQQLKQIVKEEITKLLSEAGMSTNVQYSEPTTASGRVRRVPAGGDLAGGIGVGGKSVVRRLQGDDDYDPASGEQGTELQMMPKGEKVQVVAREEPLFSDRFKTDKEIEAKVAELPAADWGGRKTSTQSNVGRALRSLRDITGL